MNTPMDDLEAFVDKWGLKGTVSALAEIALAKAEHIRTNWQDEGLAELWDHDGKKLDKVSAKILNGACRSTAGIKKENA